MGAPSYRLRPEEVPSYPEGKLWACHLRWCLAVMDHDDKDLGFIASLLAHAAKTGGLTAKQAKYAQKTLDRIRDLWMGDALDCQQPPTAAEALAVIPAEGRA